MLLGALMVVAPGAGATRGDVHKVTICHRTNAVTNPYVMPTVDFAAADGTQQGGPDHMSLSHSGPPFDPAATYPTPRNGYQWGDIIPPVPYLNADGSGEWTEGGTVWTGRWTTGRNWGLGDEPDGRDLYFGSAGEHPVYPPQPFYDAPFAAVS